MFIPFLFSDEYGLIIQKAYAYHYKNKFLSVRYK